MSATSEYYLMQAAQSEREGADAVLDNVRERSLRSAAAWRTMAERLLHAEDMRKAQAAEKAALLTP